MNKVELEQYARENRKRLEAQVVNLGDTAKVLKGTFASEIGVVVGIHILSLTDIADPYYEIELECEVDERYKMRKGLIGKGNNVVGGFNKCDFEVIGNYKNMIDEDGKCICKCELLNEDKEGKE